RIAAMAAAPTDASAAGMPVGDREVAVAFALGWQMAELYRGPRSGDAGNALPDDLPGISDFSAAETASLRFDQVDVGLGRLAERIHTAGLVAPTTATARAAAEQGAEAARRAVLTLHTGLLRV